MWNNVTSITLGTPLGTEDVSLFSAFYDGITQTVNKSSGDVSLAFMSSIAHALQAMGARFPPQVSNKSMEKVASCFQIRKLFPGRRIDALTITKINVKKINLNCSTT